MTKKFLIAIDDIENAPGKKIQVNFDREIEELNSNESVKADLVISALGDFIEVKGNVQGKVTLECDLCLDEFTYELDFEIDELFAKRALSDEYGQDTELKDGHFVTDLNGNKDIDLYDLLYQSVILDLPNKKVCGINCKGDNFLSETDLDKINVDPRLEVFKNINISDKKPKNK